MNKPKILVFAGSSRKASWNKQLAKYAAETIKASAEVTFIDLADYDMPLFNEDLESEGVPEAVLNFKKLLKTHDGLIIASPEYNGSISPLLKNAIDWASRPESDEFKAKNPGEVFKGKVAALLATSPGALGGLRGLVHVRAILSGIGVTVIPDQKAIPKAYAAFDENGHLTDDNQAVGVAAIATKLAEVTAKLST